MKLYFTLRTLVTANVPRSFFEDWTEGRASLFALASTHLVAIFTQKDPSPFPSTSSSRAPTSSLLTVLMSFSVGSLLFYLLYQYIGRSCATTDRYESAVTQMFFFLLMCEYSVIIFYMFFHGKKIAVWRKI